MNKYNYIVVCINNKMYDYAYSQLNELDYTFFDNNFPKGNVRRFFHKACFGKRTNKFIPNILKQYWINKRIQYYLKIKSSFSNSDLPICFILFSNCLPIERYGLTQKLRDSFNDCKVVYFFQDLVSTDPNKQYFLSHDQKKVDAIISYDPKDAEKYNLFFHNVPCSIMTDTEKTICSDICFIGRAKNRLDKIYEAFEYFHSLGLRCDFHVSGVNESEKKYVEYIDFFNEVSYETYLRYFEQSRIILEIVQEGSSGNTTRINEAIALGKMFISNNTSLKNNPLYYPKYMCSYTSLNDINEDFLRKPGAEYPKQFIDSIRPAKFIEYVENTVLC